MVIPALERAFPRGGRDVSNTLVSTNKSAVTKKKSLDLFGKDATKKTKLKKGKEKVKKPSQASDDIPKASSVEPLSYKTLTEGMLVVGCIADIRQYDMWLSLPGRIVGRVPITSISTQYTTALQTLAEGGDEVKKLEEMFYIGQHVVAKVVELAVDGDRTNVVLTLMPNEIHAELSHSLVIEGMVLTGALSSIEDHGYLIDFGIKSLRSFLKKKDAKSYIKNVNQNDSLGVGQLLRCIVKKVTTSASSSTVEVSIDPEEVETALVPATANINPHVVLPGMRFNVSIAQVLHDGLQIKWQNFEGFVYRDHLPNPCLPPDRQNFTNFSIEATVLYSLPIIRSVHFTLQNPHPFTPGACDVSLKESGVPCNSSIQLGQTITSAEVIYASWRGISLKLNKNGDRGFVSINHIADFGEVSEDMRAKYPPGTRLTCRILKYDPMDRVCICTMQKSLLSEKLLVLNDVKPGMSVQCRIVEIKKAGLLVQIGRNPQLKGLVPTMHVSDAEVKDMTKRFQIGQQVYGKVYKIDTEKRKLLVTLKPSLVQSKRPILISYENVSKNTWFDGTIVWIGPSFYLVSFFNDVAGKLNRCDIPGELGSSFAPGQVISCRVVEADAKHSKLKVSMLPIDDEPTEANNLQIGQEYDVKVLQITKEGLHIKISAKKGGFAHIPRNLITEHPSLAESLLNCYSPGDKLKAVYVLAGKPLPVFAINKTITEALDNCSRKWEAKAVMPCVVDGVTKSGVLVNVCVNEPNTLTFVPFNTLSDEPVEEPSEWLQKGQGLMCKINTLRSDKDSTATFKAIASGRLSEVWVTNPQTGLSLLENYLNESQRIFQHLKTIEHPLCILKPGELVTGTVTKITKNNVLADLEDGVNASISSYHIQGKKLKVGQKVRGVVLWLDVAQKQAELSLRNDVLKHVSRMQENCQQPNVEAVYRGEIIFVNENFVLYSLKGQCHGVLAYGPSKRHINDILPPCHKIGEIKKVLITKVDPGYIICGAKKELCQKKDEGSKQRPTFNQKRKANIMDGNNSVQKKKRRDSHSSNDEIQDLSDSQQVDNESKPKSEKKKRKKQKSSLTLEEDIGQKVEESVLDSQNVQTKKTKKKKDKNSGAMLADRELNGHENGIETSVKPDEANLQRLDVEEFVWNIPEVLNGAESSSDESDEEKVPKKKMTLMEKRLLATQEEERIIDKETRLMNDGAPQSADEFDRLVMASPNSSIIWVQYMSFHLQGTGIEKARAVAQKAFKTISFREEQEKINVWVALLILENTYGTQESLEKTFQQAVQLNDAFKMYTHMLGIFADTYKTEEGDAIFEKMLRKFRRDKEVWIQGGQYYLATGRAEKARLLLQRALQSLDAKEHVEVISKFALWENHHGSADRAHALYEQIISTYPQRVDIWCSYVDLIIKGGSISSARQVLQRAVEQKLSVFKMKVMFKKFLDFERQYGTEEEAELVRNMALSYVKSVTPTTHSHGEDD